MAKLTYAQQQRIARRTADITRLQSQYARSVEDYTSQVGAKETAFKAEMDKYNAAYAPYQQKATEYQSRLADYQKRLDEYQKAPLNTIATRVVTGMGAIPAGYYARYDQNRPGYQKIPDGYEAIYDGDPITYLRSIVGKDVKNPGTFNEKFDEQAPVAPAALDISAEKTKLEGDKAYTEREVDERSKARLRAVQRGNTRPMLSAGTNINKAA